MFFNNITTKNLLFKLKHSFSETHRSLTFILNIRIFKEII